MIRRNLQGIFLTDDRGAARLAAHNKIPVVTTWHLLKLAGRKPLVDANALWGYTETLRGQNRGTPPGVFDRPSFDRWLTS
ncbi:conserved hypothetical protein [Frankia canadensis]|uniref:Uncharacterized protein n=1 Tax=Frankia canadensis TaxID=1836972 RepID=A0A2I2KN77_9ACTN|nr:conserved hypothetical protein [Frankia canadensis]SOU54417.1 conserved hypothetical protein [Frankia canadensis]